MLMHSSKIVVTALPSCSPPIQATTSGVKIEGLTMMQAVSRQSLIAVHILHIGTRQYQYRCLLSSRYEYKV